MKQRGAQRRILTGAVRAGTENTTTQIGRSSTGSEAALTTAAALEFWFQPRTQPSSAQHGALRGVNGAGSCQSFSPACPQCRSVPSDAAHAALAGRPRRPRAAPLGVALLDKSNSLTHEGARHHKGHFLSLGRQGPSTAPSCNCSACWQGKYCRRTSCS